MIEIKSSLHNHTTLCDGQATPDELVRAAINEGLSDIGISGHSLAPFDIEYSIKNEDEYISAINACKENFCSQIRVWCGIEQDFLAPCAKREEFDYMIGSVHYMKSPSSEKYYSIDGSLQSISSIRDELFGGNGIALCKEYYRLVCENVLTYHPDIIGHFDLITKYNGRGIIFDEDSKAYQNAAIEALEVCCKAGGIFELNTGAIRRGARSIPYPAPFLLKELRRLSGRVILSSDCHHRDGLCFNFDNALAILSNAGFRSVCVFENGTFVEKGI